MTESKVVVESGWCGEKCAFRVYPGVCECESFMQSYLLLKGRCSAVTLLQGVDRVVVLRTNEKVNIEAAGNFTNALKLRFMSL